MSVKRTLTGAIVTIRYMTTVELDSIFRDGRTLRNISDKPVPVDLVKQAWDYAKWLPTAFNSQPLRLDVTKKDTPARTILHDASSGGNRERIDQAPLVVVLSYDPDLEHSMQAFGAPKAFAEMAQQFSDTVGPQSGALQAGYFMTALRALGVGVGPMTGVDMQAIDRGLHADNNWKTMMVVCLGYPTKDEVDIPRPRPDFDAVSVIH